MNNNAKDNVGGSERANTDATMNETAGDEIMPQGYFTFTCVDDEGGVKWKEEIPNAVVNVGKDYILGAALSGAVQTTAFYLGLISGASPTISAGDTLASKGWTESTDYSEASRQSWAEAGVSAQSISNSASPASFSINASVTIGGAFLADSNTKGGTGGLLIAAGTFSTARTLASGDTLNVTYTINA